MKRSNQTALIVVAALLFAFAPLMYYHLYGLWAEEYYQYFPFVIAAVAWLMYERRFSAAPPSDSVIARRLFWFLLVGGLTLLAAATLIWSAWLASFAFVTVMGAAALHIWRCEGRLTNQFGIWALLWLLVPIPLQFDRRLVVRLQQMSAQMSSQLLDLLGIDHLMAGVTLQLPDKQFFVDEACSGIVSVMSVIASGAIYAVWKNRTLPHTITLLLLGIVWAVVMNVGRITSIAIAHDWFGIDLSTGWQHEVLGLVLFSLTFLSLISSDAMLTFLNEPIITKAADGNANRNPLVKVFNYLVGILDPQRQSLALAGMPAGATSPEQVTTAAGNSEPASTNTPEKAHNRTTLSSRFVLTTSVVCVVLGALQLVVLSRGYQDPETPVELALSLDSDFLPDTVGDWKKIDFESIERTSSDEFGNYSKQFVYENSATQESAIVSFDFPYRGGWHELSVCYRNFGWPMIDRTVTELPVTTAAGQQTWPVINADYEKTDGQRGFLAFSGTNGTADCLEPPSTLVLWRPWFRLRRRLLRRMSPRFFQFQAWHKTDKEISTETKEDVMELFMALRPIVLERLATGTASVSTVDIE